MQGNETILLTEDEPAVRKLVRDALEQLGYTVLPAADGYEALRILEGHGGTVHLLLTDVIMPLMSGPELVKRVRSVKPATKVVYMSGYTDGAIAPHGVLEPGISILRKPFTRDELARRLDEVLAGVTRP